MLKFETIQQARTLARKKIRINTFKWLEAAAENGFTKDKNVKDLENIKIIPKFLNKVGKINLRKKYFEHYFSSPILLSPIGHQTQFHRLGEIETAKGAEKSKIILFLLDTTQDIQSQLLELEKIKKQHSEKLLAVVNKTDISESTLDFENTISISAKSGVGIEYLKKELLNFVNISSISDNESIVTNLRHYEELQLTLHEIESIIDGMQSGISGDFLSINIRQALFHLGSITGEVTTDDLLGNIFGKFCIGK